jgi:hypothetical protein
MKTVNQYFDDLRSILRPWLYEVVFWNLPSNPDDIIVCMQPANVGFRNLNWYTSHANPPWILPEWRTSTGVICPRCQTEIQALLKSHRVGQNERIGAPFIFCSCVRLEPSRFPSARFGTRTAFFTDHWSTVLEALEFFEQVSVQLASTDKQYLHGLYAEYLRCNDARRYHPQH